MEISLILEKGSQYNGVWLQTIGLNHWLYAAYKILHQKSLVFSETSCEVTAAMIRWKLTGKDEWKLLEDTTFDIIQHNHKYFQISIGEGWEDFEHVLTVYDNMIIQSYYNKYKIKSLMVTPEIVEAINNISKPENYEKVTTVKCTLAKIKNYKVFYWVPEK